MLQRSEKVDIELHHQQQPKRISNAGFQASLTSFDREVTVLKRKNTQVKSRLPTFGSLTTAKPMLQGSKVDIGVRKGHFAGSGVTQQSDNGRTRLTDQEPHHHYHHMKSHQPPSSSSSMSFKGGHSINSFKAPLSQFSVEAPGGERDQENSFVNQVIQENQKLDEQLTDLFKHYCDRFKPMDGKTQGAKGQLSSGMAQSKNILRRVNRICAQAWLKEPSRHTHLQTPNQISSGFIKPNKAFPTAADISRDAKSSSVTDMSEIEALQEQERITDLVNITKRINYLARKKAELQGPIQELRHKITQTRKEKSELKPVYESYEFQTYQDLIDEMANLTESLEYRENAEKDPNHYLVQAVGQMRAMAPGLKKYQELKRIYREDRLKVTELEQIYKATCEAFERLRLNEKYLLDSSFEGRGLEISANGSIIDFFGHHSQHYNRSDNDSATGSISMLSRQSNLPLVHVDNYFQNSASSFNY